MSKGEVANPLPDFENPPVLEVVSGVQFETLAGMQTRHFGQFWSLVNDRFPATQDAPPLPDILETPRVEFLPVPPLRRVVLISKDNNYVVQVQDSRFHVNWRKTRESAVYPRFKEVFSEFSKLWDQFGTFVSQAGIGTLKPNRYELTYVNHIDANSSDVPSSVESMVRMYRWSDFKPEFLPSPTSVSASWQFRLPDKKGQMNANLSHAERNKRPIVVLNMSCGGPASADYSLDEWFETAHEWIVRGFTDLTTRDAHQKWGRQA